MQKVINKLINKFYHYENMPMQCTEILKAVKNHYENVPMQCIEIFKVVKNEIFQ